MKAVVITSPGGPEVLQVADVPDPVVGAGQVLLEVTAAGANRADLLQREGRYPPPPGVVDWPGLEVSGRVAEVGAGVTDWAAGDLACALLAGGGYAERVVVPDTAMLPVPDGLGVIEAAALPEAACTVWSNVFMLAGLRPGETLLVHGGGSGIGTMAVQLAKQVGARVAVTAGSTRKLERCTALGADIAINYREQDFVAEIRTATEGHGADVILDNMGAAYLDRNLRALAVNGRLVVIGLQGGRTAELDLATLLTRRATVLATSLRARPEQEKAAIVAGVREHVWPLLVAGTVHPVVHSVLPLHQAAEAHRLLEASEQIGKVLLTPTR